MKAFNIVLTVLLIVSVIFYFSKLSDPVCLEKARARIEGMRNSRIPPGIGNPALENPGQPIRPEAIFVKDKILWKEIDYIEKGRIRIVGYSWLGSFHPAKNP
jgi:hypothetical protein